MRSMPPLITGEEEYQGYQRGRGTLTKAVRERVQRLLEALASGDEALIEARRFELLHVLSDRQATVDMNERYEQYMRQSAEPACMGSTSCPAIRAALRALHLALVHDLGAKPTDC